jgi:hypothetical protein
MVFSNLISEFSCKTIRGCGKKGTRLSYLLFAVLSIIFREFFDALYGHRQSTQCKNCFLCGAEIFNRMKKNLELFYGYANLYYLF